MNPEAQPDIRIDIHLDGVFIRTLVLTAAEILARADAPINVEHGPPCRWSVVNLLPGEGFRLGIDVRRHPPYDGRPIEPKISRYNYQSARELPFFGGVTTVVYDAGGPIHRVDISEPPPDEPHVTD